MGRNILRSIKNFDIDYFNERSMGRNILRPIKNFDIDYFTDGSQKSSTH